MKLFFFISPFFLQYFIRIFDDHLFYFLHVFYIFFHFAEFQLNTLTEIFLQISSSNLDCLLCHMSFLTLVYFIENKIPSKKLSYLCFFPIYRKPTWPLHHITHQKNSGTENFFLFFDCEIFSSIHSAMELLYEVVLMSLYRCHIHLL